MNTPILEQARKLALRLTASEQSQLTGGLVLASVIARLRDLGLVDDRPWITDLGRAVQEAFGEAKEIASHLPDLERNVLRAVKGGPIMEADIGPAELQVNALVQKGLLQWCPEGCVYTDLGELVARVFEKAVTP